jgi:hypothetical protein
MSQYAPWRYRGSMLRLGVARAVTGSKDRTGVVEATMDGARVGVEDELVWIEAQTELGPVRAVDTIAIRLTRAQLRNISVPDVSGALREGDALGFVRVIRVGEEADFDRGGVLGEEREIDARAVPMGTKRERCADPRPRASPRMVSARRGFGCQDAHAVASPIQSTRSDTYGGENYTQGDRY